MKAVILLFSLLLIFQPVIQAKPNPQRHQRQAQKRAVKWQLFIRAELFFGTAKKDGTEVTEADWKRFVDEQITPGFPDGLTVITASGQYLDHEHKIEKEKSFILILFYPQKLRRTSSRKIEAIRESYKKAFAQESVLRVDSPLPVRVSF